MRKLLLRNKVFLHLLYSDPWKKTKQRLSLATDFQARTLIHILRYISLSVIPVKKDSRKELKLSKRMYVLNEMLKKDVYERMLSDPKEKKIEYLRQLTKLYPVLLHRLFNNDE